MSKIQFYQSELTPQKNAWIEDIEKFLGPNATYRNDNFQYQKIQLEMDVVIPVMQHSTIDSVGNYCKIEQDGNKYFFFVLGADWASVNAVRLHLSLDTINTFGDKLVFDPRTMIQRQHQDRFLVDYNFNQNLGDSNTLLRKIDKEPEGLTPIKERVDEPLPLVNSDDDTNWFLIYQTAKELSEGNLDNPIACYLIADKPLPLSKSGGPSKTFSVHDLKDGEYAYFDVLDNTNGQLIVDMMFGGYQQHYNVVMNQSYEGCKWRGLILNRRGSQLLAASFFDYPVEFSVGYGSTVKDIVAPNIPGMSGSVQITSDQAPFIPIQSIKITNGNILKFSNTSYRTPEAVTLGDARSLELSIGPNPKTTVTLEDIDRTDSRIMKIIKLPYAPTNVTFEGGIYKFGSEWEYENGLMRLKNKDLSTEFESTVGQLPLYVLLTQDVRNDPLKPKNIDFESKLYNSNFFTYKVYYDEFVKELKLEDFQPSPAYRPMDPFQYTMNVHFKPTNTINSKFAFKFDMDQIPNFIHKTQEDFEDFLLVNRNNEVAIFSNDYVNYMRSGYNYDKKAHDISQQQAVVNAVLGMAGAGAQVGGGLFSSYAQEKNRISHLTDDQLKQERVSNFVAANLSKDDPRRTIFRNSAFASASPFTLSAGISMATSAIQSAVNIHYANASFENQMAGKQAQLKAQSSSVSGADDVDLLSYYCDNKLKVAEYEPKPLTKKAIYDLFYYTGYNHLTQAIPNLDSRFWFNFIQCDPVFKDENIAVYHEYLEDIKERFRLGVTKYHHRPNFEIEWNFNQDRENLENRLCEYDKVPSSKLSLGAINFVQRSQGNDVSVTWKNTHPLDNYTECLRFRYELGGKLTYIDTTRANQESIILFGAQGTSGIQVQRVDRWNSKFNSDWSNI